MPVAKPKAYMPILTGEEIFSQIVIEEATANIRNRSAIPTRV
jgi:hypothetical protein